MKNIILKFDGGAYIASAASAVGKCEREGPIGECFDICDMTDKFGMKTWEMAESEMQRLAFNTALAKLSASEREQSLTQMIELALDTALKAQKQ